MKKDITKELLDVVRSVVTPLQFKPPILPVTIDKKGGDEEEANLVISDIHLGEENPKYNMRVAKRRITGLVDSTMKIVSLHRKAYPVRKLNIFFCGDIVTGENIFPTQPHEIETGVVHQIFDPAPHFVEQLLRLCCYFKEVRCFAICGNHGRVGKFANKLSNWDRVFYEVLRMATSQVPNIIWEIPDEWYLLAKVLNTRILCTHGHQIKMWMNLPWYGVTTRVARWAITEGIGKFDILLLGHFHSSSRIQWNNKIILINGTTVDGDEFALEKMGLESSQCQWLFGIHPRQGITWSYEIDFK